jgi:phenylalanyl-tRNA synthetase beta chain
MLVSLKWLREYVDLPDDLDVDDLAHRLTMASTEVEGVTRVGAEWDRELITVGEVLAVDPHPDADRLRLATVNYGGDAPQRVVCGAPNLEVGQRIAFGREGSTLIDPRSGDPSKLKRARIRGVESSGMVLSEAELGISDSHEGIIELPADAPIGTPLADYLGDVILDVHTWPNRADTMNMVGIAREVAAIVGGTLTLPDESYEEGASDASDAVAIEIEDPDLCARYVGAVIEGISVGPSPAWMQERLTAAGMRPISNVVDITNYVMLELGQPLHAFDLDTLEGTVGVRLAREGETLRTLDGQDRELSPDTLLITDDSGPIALAGVMGGLATEVTEGTTNVLLEAARFDPTSIRRTSTRLDLRSEASRRFERGLSPELASHAAARATKLFVEIGGGTGRRGVVDVYPRPHENAEVTITRGRLDTIIGLEVPSTEVEAILGTLGFEVLESAGDDPDGTFRVRAPWWRTDIAIADDIAEEVVRLAGYDRLPATNIRGRIAEWEPDPALELREALRDALVGAGLQEVVTYALTTDEVLARVMAPEDLSTLNPLRLRNTLSSDREVLRPTLRHALIEVVDRNVRAGADDIAVFEAGRVYLPLREGDPLPDEREMVVGAVSGQEADRWGRPTGRHLDFYDAKGILDAAFEALGIEAAYVASESYGMAPGRVAEIEVHGVTVGIVGDMGAETLLQFGVEQPVTLFELDIARLLDQIETRRTVEPVSRFPAVVQDLAVVVDGDTPAGAVQALIEAGGLVARADVFDVYRGDQVAAGKKSIAFAIRYQAPDRTLTTEDANKEQDRIIRRLEREFGATIRS